MVINLAVVGWALFAGALFISTRLVGKAKDAAPIEDQAGISKTGIIAASVVVAFTLIAMAVNVAGYQLMSAVTLYAGFCVSELSAFIAAKRLCVGRSYIKNWGKSVLVWLPCSGVALVLVYLSP